MPTHEEREQERMNAVRSSMVRIIWGFSLALKQARCNKAFRRFRTALAETGAIDRDNQLWLDSFAIDGNDRYHLMRTALSLVVADVGETTEVRKKIGQLARDIREYFYYFGYPRFDDIRPEEFRGLEGLLEEICERLS